MKTKKVLSLLTAASMTVAMMAGFSGVAYAEEEEGKVYGVSVMTHNNSFFLAEIEGIENALNENDEIMAPDPALDVQTQIDQISDMISAKVDIIIVDAIDSEGIKTALVEAEAAGIPVIAIDTEVADAELVASTIISDNVEAGRLAGKALLDAMGGSGKVAIIDHNEVKCVRDRTDGFEEVLEDYPDVEVVYRQSAHGNVTESQEHTEVALQGDPDITGIFAINDPTAAGSVAAIKGAGLEGVSVVAVDGSQDAIDMIKSGDLLADAAQDPVQIGEKAVEVARAIFAGEEYEEVYTIPISLITAENVDEYDGNTF